MYFSCMASRGCFLSFIGVVSFNLSGASSNQSPRIYVYPLPKCSFDHFVDADIDGTVVPFHEGRPPLLPIHHRIARGRYATSDPSNATVFYIPAPFFLWDISWLNNERKCGSPIYETDKARIFSLARNAIPLSGVQPILGNHSRTITLWIRASREQETSFSEYFVVIAIGLGTLGGTLIQIRNGCPVISSYGIDHEIMCKASIANGKWRHLAVSFDGSNVKIYIDTSLVETKEMVLNSGNGEISLGGLGERENGKHQRFRGEVREVILWDYALSDEGIRKCGIEATLDVERSLESHCFKFVRQYIEASPWFQKKHGWDHFVLFAGFDYPASFNPIGPPDESDYVLEEAWPAFANFSILHFGARTERCFVSLADPARADLVGLEHRSCVRRFFRTITIPPFLPHEQLTCQEKKKHFDARRQSRIAYRGLAYSAMIERQAIRSAASSADISLLQESQQIRLEFTNWTHELLNTGKCTVHDAFEGLCSWKHVGRQAQTYSLGKSRATTMKRRALELWKTSETCLVLPGDGGYELRLFSMMNLGCIPVIVHTSGRSLPKLPFVRALPWHRFSIIWPLKSDSEKLLMESAHQLILQLLHLSTTTILKKRSAMLWHAHFLSWNEEHGTSARCGGKGRRLDSALDLLMDELVARVSLPFDVQKMMSYEYLDLKLPYQSMEKSVDEDLTGNGCPAGYPLCEIHHGDPLHGDVCKASLHRSDWRCPIGCTQVVGRPPYCVQGGAGEEVACHSSKCTQPIEHVEPVVELGYGRTPRLAIITLFGRQSLSTLTRRRLERFSAEHPGRYDLLFEVEGLLDTRDWHPSWNKIALLKRALIMGSYDAVIWIDDNVWITNATSDPIYEAIVASLTKEHAALVSAAAHGNRYRVPFDTSVIALNKGSKTMKLLDSLFRIGRKRYLIDGVWHQPRLDHFELAFGFYLQEHGRQEFVELEQRAIVSAVCHNVSFWQPGDFAAHFQFSDEYDLLQVLRGFGERAGISDEEKAVARKRALSAHQEDR